jgi:hypothetical protein
VKGERTHCVDNYTREGTRYSIIPLMNCHEILDYRVLTGTCNGALYKAVVNDYLVRVLGLDHVLQPVHLVCIARMHVHATGQCLCRSPLCLAAFNAT